MFTFYGEKLAESVMQPLSINRLQSLVCSIGANVTRTTVVDYLDFMQDAYLIIELTNYAQSLSERESAKKRYFVNNGILQILLPDPETKLLENLIAINLYQCYGDRLYFYNKNIEVDFFIPEEGIAVQVSYDISEASTFKRETTALVKMNRFFNTKRNILITRNKNDILRIGDVTIQIVSIVNWLLREHN